MQKYILFMCTNNTHTDSSRLVMCTKYTVHVQNIEEIERYE